jgi:hypothetical protein
LLQPHGLVDAGDAAGSRSARRTPREGNGALPRDDRPGDEGRLEVAGLRQARDPLLQHGQRGFSFRSATSRRLVSMILSNIIPLSSILYSPYTVLGNRIPRRAGDFSGPLRLLAPLPGKNSRSALKQFSRRALRCGGRGPRKISDAHFTGPALPKVLASSTFFEAIR